MPNNKKLVIKPEFCKGCEICVELCPKHALEMKNQKVQIKDLEECIQCGICELRCPDYAIFLEEIDE